MTNSQKLDHLAQVTTGWVARDLSSPHGRLRDALINWRQAFPPSFTTDSAGASTARMVIAPPGPARPEDAMLLHLTRAEADRLIGLLHQDTTHQLDGRAGVSVQLGVRG
ncbi:hypothetical protein OG204_02900 [Streptomyces sp. NBC_01387]|uniref:hypothetical protein n=1 Tax=unclassified Streptomyces TaxID=2593676 RepID=UPI0022537B78|nr:MULTISPECIES: hypothetical protein [unclassified Streptomyces]MCX4552764.1 hypothetical protein [Streptomyces sp. NBC_01500]WSC24102.1 hypothetical protein OIE60_32950 [Streptomyces sp. NBC_01766]WSV57988.1 hypothetical protein OG282_32225 [Streptomyces sp. NBC_01014]